jgi:hypothetical protein
MGTFLSNFQNFRREKISRLVASYIKGIIYGCIEKKKIGLPKSSASLLCSSLHIKFFIFNFLYFFLFHKYFIFKFFINNLLYMNNTVEFMIIYYLIINSFLWHKSCDKNGILIL